MDNLKIIFLDIDGVLNSEDFYRERSAGGSLYELFLSKSYPLSEFDPRAIDNLNYIIDRTGAKIVLSSSWRTDDRECLLNIFREVGIPDFIDKTPVIFEIDPLTQKSIFIPRGKEIEKFLTCSKYNGDVVKNYVILDDDACALPEQIEHFIKINPWNGLTKVDADKAIKILNG